MHNRQVFYRGERGVGDLGDDLVKDGVAKLLLITGTSSFEKSGAATDLGLALKARFETQICSASSRVTQAEDVRHCYDAVRRWKPDAIVAIGGGSVIDRAKIALYCHTAGCDPVDASTHDARLANRSTRLIAVPTTAGSGSESTHFAVLYVDGTKQSIADEELLPDAVLFRPAYIARADSAVRVAAGLDALAQAIESCWSIRATPVSVDLSLRALRGLASNLESIVSAPTVECCTEMQAAANLAGQAINIARTTACHAVSYPLTYRFGVLHGVAVFLTLPEVLRFNASITDSDCADPRGVSSVHERLRAIATAMGCANVEAAANRLQSFLRTFDVPSSLREIGADQAELESAILRDLDPVRLENNPRRLLRDSVEMVLRAAW
ncbi:MAG: phosphonoacetaldehyde reductase [Chloroflexi bacterium]|nr:phosphonoacetaldehyde reductase [Chloroflexota bacterium]